MDENIGRDQYVNRGQASAFEPDTLSAETEPNKPQFIDEQDTAVQTGQEAYHQAEDTAQQQGEKAGYQQRIDYYGSARQNEQSRQQQSPVIQQPQNPGFGNPQPAFYAQQPVYPYPPQPPVFAGQPVGNRQSAQTNPGSPVYTVPVQYQPVYIPQNQQYPPVGMQPQYLYPQQPAAPGTTKEKKMNGGKIALLIFGALVELALLFFAIYGIIALANGGSKTPDPVEENRGQIIVPNNPDDGNGLIPDLRDLLPNIQSPGEGNQPPQQIPDIGGITSPRTNPTDIKLGIVVSEVTDAQVSQYKVPKGLIVMQIGEESSLNGTEVQVGDIITSFDGKPVETTDQLHEYFGDYKAGDTVKLSMTHVNNDGSMSNYEVDAKLLKNDAQSQQQISEPKADNEISRPSV